MGKQRVESEPLIAALVQQDGLARLESRDRVRLLDVHG